MEEEQRAEEITKAMFPKMIKLSDGKVFNNKVSFSRQTSHFLVLPHQWIAEWQRVTSRYSTHREVKRQAHVKPICSEHPVTGGEDSASLGFKKEDRRPQSRSFHQQSLLFSETTYQYEWFHLELCTLLQYTALYSRKLCLKYFFVAEGTQASSLISLLSPLAQTTLRACSLHL